MRTLVTGGAGFIGSHLVQRLVGEGHDVVVLDDLSTGSLSNLEGVLPDVEVIEGDLRDNDVVTRAVRDSGIVYHLGAIPSVQGSIRDPKSTMDVGVTGTLNVLTAARDGGSQRVVLASSSAVYGDNPVSPKTETLTPDPLSPYALSKLTGEHLCRIFANVYSLQAVALRFFNVYGPRQDPNSEYSAVIPRFIHQAVNGQAPIVYGDGEQTRDFVYIDDVVDSLLSAGEQPGVSGGVFNIGSGIATSLNDLLSAISAVANAPLHASFTEARPGDIRHSIADISAARETLGFAPSVSLREGIRRVHGFFAGMPSAGRSI